MLEIQNLETLRFAIALSCFNYNHFQIGFLLLCFRRQNYFQKIMVCKAIAQYIAKSSKAFIVISIVEKCNS